MQRVLVFLTIAHLAAALPAAELQVREQAVASGPLVLLSDVAEIHLQPGEGEEELAEVDLLPTPPAGEKRVLRLRELQDLLALRGINLVRHRFSGASQVTIHGRKREIASTKTVIAPPARTISKPKIHDNIEAAILACLVDQTEASSVTIKFEISDATMQTVAAMGDTLIASGGSSPFAGKQRFSIHGGDPKNAVEIQALLTLPPSVVVATRALPRGVILNADDVKLQPGKGTEGKAEVFQSLEEVIGKETARVVTEGQILDDRAVRRQLLVHRNEVVTVYSRTGGICVRLTARTREDGSSGDLVTVETIDTRKGFLARVCGPQEVEVFAQAASTASPSEPPRPIKKALHKTAPPAPLPAEDPTFETAASHNEVTR